jgi:hypothetical protein
VVDWGAKKEEKGVGQAWTRGEIMRESRAFSEVTDGLAHQLTGGATVHC